MLPHYLRVTLIERESSEESTTGGSSKELQNEDPVHLWGGSGNTVAEAT